ncbi:MAG: FadR family transcriptional regulator [Rhizobiaceae bacterium]|nr:FadR family transcriptional regulator [Rhizobiaceae bacterium]
MNNMKNKGPLGISTAAGALAGTHTMARSSGSLHGMVVERLGFLIASGEFKAGDVLPNADELSERLGVGRSVLREGLKVLSGKGMIEARPKTGTRVRPRAEWNHLDPDLLAWRYASPSVEDVGSIFDLRRAIEPAAAALCAKKASAEQIAQLSAILDEMSATADDSDRFAGPDLSFHQALMRFTGNELISTLGSVVEMALLISFRLSDDRGGQRHSLPLHKGVLDRIRDRDEEGARQAVVTLLNDAEADVRRALERRSKGERRNRSTADKSR